MLEIARRPHGAGGSRSRRVDGGAVDQEGHTPVLVAHT